MPKFFVIFILLAQLSISSILAQKKDSLVVYTEKPITEKWSDKISLRGYGQLRYNKFISSKHDATCAQCDKPWVDGNGLSLRTLRLSISNQVTKKIFVKIEPEFEASAGQSLGILQIRDAYVDLSIDNDNRFRFRIGQSKVPYGFENLQSTQNRLNLDRSDAINSALPGEGDLGIFFFWTPKEVQKRFKSIMDQGLKGTGSYGLFSFGIFNGQTLNKAELNNNEHVVARITYPFLIGKHFIETSLQAYSGKYQVAKESLASNVSTTADKNYADRRICASLIIYPQPFGFQTEYNLGTGPQFNTQTASIQQTHLNGGYVMVNYKINVDNYMLFPFLRAQYYDGGKKQEQDSRSYLVKEIDFGTEWQLNKYLEFTATYALASRRYEDYATQVNFHNGNMLRFQAQVNF